MRFILIALATMLLVVSVTQAQDTRLPVCTPADIALAQSMQGGATRLVIEAAAIESMAELLSFGTEQLAWREEMWAQLPLCDEGIAYGIALDQLSETLPMKLLLQSAGVAAEDNPYTELGLESAKEVNRLESDLSAAAGAGDAATTGELRACSAEERDQLTGEFWSGIVKLVDTLHAVKSFEALLGYIDATLAWRAAVWSQLPPCSEAYEIAIWKAHFTADIAKLYMLDLFDIKRADNPFGQTYLRGIVKFSDYKQWIDMTGRDFRSLPSCVETTIDQDLHQAFRRHHDWTDIPHGSIDELPAFAAAHIAWRETLMAALPALPGCREAVETALLTIQITGDAATLAALSLSGIGLQELGADYQERIVSAGFRIDELNRALQVEPSADAAGPAAGLPECSNKDLDILFDDLQGLSQLQQQAFDIEWTDEIIVYIQDYFEWRDKLWSALPGCAEAFQIARVMLQMLGDYATRIAMLAADVSEDALPYHEQTERGVDAFSQWHADVWAPIEAPVSTPIEAPVSTPGPITTYYVIADGSAPLYECASSDCEIVGLFAEGAPLQVVDDSGEWHKVYIGADLYGYIRRESTSATPPDS